MAEQARIALVTGAGSGIGRHVALGLMRDGYTVFLAGRRLEPLESARDAAREFGGTGHAVPTDVSSPESVAALFREISERYGRLDVLFNNAGTFGAKKSLEDLAYDEWREVVDVNLSGMFLCLQGAFRMMKAQRPGGGRIINNGSIAAHSPRPNTIAYVATKHAVTGLTKAASLDGRAYDIACGQIDIGNAATDMTRNMEQGITQADGSVRVEPTMDVDNVVRAVSYMASLPLDANVQFMTVMATKMPFIARG